jgi:branched-chain amino acid transport system ATP-binding protein
VSAAPALALSDVTVAFGALRAVDGVSLSVPEGERRGIIGPNGAGKTTLFQAIAGMVRAAAGRVVFRGEDITTLAPHRRARRGIARTFQITNLFPTLTVRENLFLALRGGGGNGRGRFSFLGPPRMTAGESRRAEEALIGAHLAHRAETLVRDLSYGEQRQVELALAFASRPRLLLLDEPAAGLSPAERALVAGLIRGLPREITLVLIEHDMDLVLGLVDRVTCLHEGRVLVEAPPAEIRRNEAVQEVYLGRPRHLRGTGPVHA